jgi:hypothetical protein
MTYANARLVFAKYLAKAGLSQAYLRQ